MQNAALEHARKAFERVGALFRPLRDPDEVAAFIDLEAGLHAEIPRHAQRLHEGFQARGVQSVGTSWEAGQLLNRMTKWPAIGAVIKRLRRLSPMPGDVVALVSPATACVSCGSTHLHIDERPSHPVVHAGAGRAKGELYSKVCHSCGARHGLSFASGGGIPEHHVRPLPNCLENPYFQVYSAVYSTAHVMLRYSAQAAHSHTAFYTFCNEYFSLTGDQMDRRAFASAYLVFTLVHYHTLWADGAALPAFEVDYQQSVDGETRLDRTLRITVKQLFRWFITEYAKHHSKYCRQPGCCNSWVIDGHMKWRRTVCDNNAAREIDMGELGTAVLNCSHTPLRGSRFCFSCRSAAARCSVQCYDVDEEQAAVGIDDAPEQHLNEASEAVSAELQSGPEELEAEEPVAAAENQVFLVERLLESRVPLAKNADGTYRATSWKRCRTAKHKEYLVKFVHYETPYWVCQCDIGRAALQEGCQPQESTPPGVRDAEKQQDTLSWRSKHTAVAEGSGPPSSRTRHAGQRAADLAGAETGDFKKSKEDDAIECKTLKEDQYAGKIKRTTAGILALVSSCGLFLAADEIVGSESLTQVHLFLFSIFFLHKVDPPEVLAYDDGCHLLRFWQLRVAISSFVKWLLTYKLLQVVVDRFHFRNHVGKCKAPESNPREDAATRPRQSLGQP